MCRVPTQLISLSLARSLTLHCVVLYIFEFYIFGKNTLIFLNMLTSARDNFHQRKTSYNVLCVGIELFYPYFVCIKFRANYKLKFNRYTYIFAYRPSKGIVWPTSTGCIENKNSIVLFFFDSPFIAFVSHYFWRGEESIENILLMPKTSHFINISYGMFSLERNNKKTNNKS